MKKLIQILLFLFILNITYLSAQTYDFNYLISYSVESLPNCKGESAIYINAKNDGYYLKLVKFSDNLKALIIDSSSNKVHYFTVNETKEKNEILFGFQYDYSGDFKKSIWYHNPKSVLSITDNTNEDVNNIELQVYKNHKKKKIESNFSLDVKKSENFFSAFKYCCIHPHQFKNEQNPENILVIKATETTKKGKLINYELKTLKKVNFQLVVPIESEMKSNNPLH